MSEERTFRVGLDDALQRVESAGDKRWAVVFEHGSLEVELYAPRGTDPQQPHTRDEAYIVVAGRGSFECSGQRSRFAPGDFLFAPAGAVHRFVDFSDDLVVWVLFYGPEGGERP